VRQLLVLVLGLFFLVVDILWCVVWVVMRGGFALNQLTLSSYVTHAPEYVGVIRRSQLTLTGEES